MPGFLTPEDIANRACQHCRAERITAFSDYSGPAKELEFVYDKLREAELRRNSWRFAIRRAVLRTIDEDTLLWTPDTYAAGTYALNAIVVYRSEWWQSKVASNTATPAAGASWRHYYGPDSINTYDDAVHYHAGELVKPSSTIYMSLKDGNTDTPPTSNWLAIGGTTAALQILYPIGAGPASDRQTASVCRLPHGYLRRVNSDPKGSMRNYLGVPAGSVAEDWVPEGDYIVTWDRQPLTLRYVADFTDVPDMDPMFCEALGARMGVECAPKLAEAGFVDKAISRCERVYKRQLSEAGIVNGIEQGSQSPQLDDYITVRW